jgi:hypothetical protein
MATVEKALKVERKTSSKGNSYVTVTWSGSGKINGFTPADLAVQEGRNYKIEVNRSGRFPNITSIEATTEESQSAGSGGYRGYDQKGAREGNLLTNAVTIVTSLFALKPENWAERTPQQLAAAVAEVKAALSAAIYPDETKKDEEVPF